MAKGMGMSIMFMTTSVLGIEDFCESNEYTVEKERY